MLVSGACEYSRKNAASKLEKRGRMFAFEYIRPYARRYEQYFYIQTYAHAHQHHHHHQLQQQQRQHHISATPRRSIYKHSFMLLLLLLVLFVGRLSICVSVCIFICWPRLFAYEMELSEMHLLNHHSAQMAVRMRKCASVYCDRIYTFFAHV